MLAGVGVFAQVDEVAQNVRREQLHVAVDVHLLGRAALLLDRNVPLDRPSRRHRIQDDPLDSRENGLCRYESRLLARFPGAPGWQSGL